MQYIFGGSFNPVHNGHIQCLQALIKRYHIANITLLPAFQSPFKQANDYLPAQQRWQLLQLATAEYCQLSLCAYEINAAKPVTTFASMQYFQQTGPCTFIMGADSLATLHRWYRWQDMLQLCNILVLPRLASEQPVAAVNSALCDDWETFVSRPHGQILIADIDPITVSSSQLRDALNRQDYQAPILQENLSKKVLEYIIKHQLYK